MKKKKKENYVKKYWKKKKKIYKIKEWGKIDIIYPTFMTVRKDIDMLHKCLGYRTRWKIKNKLQKYNKKTIVFKIQDNLKFQS